MGGEHPEITGTHVYQTDVLTGVFTHNYQFTIENVTWHQFESRFVSIDILSDPAFSFQPHDGMQPFQAAFNVNLIALTWPHIGPLIIQNAVTAGGQYTDGEGGAFTLGAGIDLSVTHIPWLTVSGSVEMDIRRGADGAVEVSTSVPVNWFTLRGHF